ncbi:hypothetical protein YC2023_016971 [Brassica napus]
MEEEESRRWRWEYSNRMLNQQKNDKHNERERSIYKIVGREAVRTSINAPEVVLAVGVLQAAQGKMYTVLDQEEYGVGVATEETEGEVATEGGVAMEEKEGGVAIYWAFTLSSSSSPNIYKFAIDINTSTTMNYQIESIAVVVKFWVIGETTQVISRVQGMKSRTTFYFSDLFDDEDF